LKELSQDLVTINRDKLSTKYLVKVSNSL